MQEAASLAFPSTRPPDVMSAAALSAAVDSTYSQETAPNSQGHTVRKKNQCSPQPFFGGSAREALSAKEAASLRMPPRVPSLVKYSQFS